MARRWVVATIPMLCILGSACGGGSKTAAGAKPTSAGTTSSTSVSPTASPGPTCSPHGTKLKIASSPFGLSFNTSCLAVPASTAFTVTFDNRTPSVPHDVAIASPGEIDIFFKGEVITGPAKITYHVKALAAGTYTFYCKIHPAQMNGTFLVS